MFDFMVIGDTLYKVNRSTGEAWKNVYGLWRKVEEQPKSEQKTNNSHLRSDS